MHVVHRQQWPRSQIVKKERQPEPANGDWHHQIQPVEIEILMKVRLDIPEQVHEAHEQQPCSQPHQRGRIAFKLSRKQQQEGHGEMEDDQRQSDDLPS